MDIILIAALSENRVIGNNGKIPWHIPEDLKRFRKLTLEHPVIMGRKTYESIGKPLEKRTNFVVTRNKEFNPEGIVISYSIEEAIEKACRKSSPIEEAIEKAEEYKKEIYIIGGEEIYRQTIDLATKLRLTEVKGEYEGDAYFPEIDENKWVKGVLSKFDKYSFVTYIKR